MDHGDVSGRVLGLTGPPRIERAIYDDQVGVVARGVRVQEVFQGTGRRVLLEERYRVEGEISWGAMREGRMLALRSDISRTTWLLEIRTAGQGETGEPLAVIVRTTSPIPLTSGLDRTDARSGRPLAAPSVSFRSLELFTGEQIGLTTASLSS